MRPYHSELIGQKHRWQLQKQVSEGDAGEVWLVKRDTGEIGVVKRPRQRIYVPRQFVQIQFEGDVLEAMAHVQVDVQVLDCKIRPVRLLDRSQPGTENSLNTFIVIERAAGFDLEAMLNAQQGRLKLENYSSQERDYLNMISQQGRLPLLLPLGVLDGIASLLNYIHRFRWGKSYGVLWNNINIGNIFWDPFHRRLTIINWGNAKALDPNGISNDQRFSTQNDHQQYCDILGLFIQQAAPEMVQSLQFGDCDQFNQRQMAIIQSRTQNLSAVESTRLRNKLDRVRNLQISDRPYRDVLKELLRLQSELMDYGEVLQVDLEQDILLKVFRAALLNRDLDTYIRILEISPDLAHESYKTLAGIIQEANAIIPKMSGDPLTTAIQRGLANDWISAYWELWKNSFHVPTPSWWSPVRARLLTQILDYVSEAPTPLGVLRSICKNLDSEPDRVTAMLDQVIMGWKIIPTRQVTLEHDENTIPTPKSSFEYPEKALISGILEKEYPDDWERFRATLVPAETAASNAALAWSLAEFERLGMALKTWSLHDPDRRLLTTLFYYAVQRAAQWWNNSIKGPGGRGIKDFVGDILETGIDIRWNVAPAQWLDGRLEVLNKLSDVLDRGNFDGIHDIVDAHPDAIEWFPWLSEYLPGVRPSATPPPIDKKPWEAFYDYLQARDYDAAREYLNIGALSGWPAYQDILKTFIEKDATLLEVPPKSDAEVEPLGPTKRLHAFDVTPGDTQYLQVIEVLGVLENWKTWPARDGLSKALEKLKMVSETHPKWAILGGLYQTLNKRWKKSDLADALEREPKENWLSDVVPLSDEVSPVIQPLRNAARLWQEIEYITKTKRWKSTFSSLRSYVQEARKQIEKIRRDAVDKNDLALLLAWETPHAKRLWEQVSSLAEMAARIDSDYWNYFVWWRYVLPVSKKKVKAFLQLLGRLELCLTGAKKRSSEWMKYVDQLQTSGRIPVGHPLQGYPKQKSRSIFFWIMDILIIAVLGLVLFRTTVSELPFIYPVTATETATSTLTYSPTSAPTQTFTPSPTPSPTSIRLTATPSYSLEHCTELVNLASIGSSNAYQELHDKLRGVHYDALRASCRWTTTQLHTLIDAHLLALFSEQAGISNQSLEIATELRNLMTVNYPTISLPLDFRQR